MSKIADMSRDQIIARYPRIVAHIICHSLGYATPSVAASILKAAATRTPHWCEWIACCYNTDAKKAVRHAIENRHHHRGFMQDYRHACRIVKEAIDAQNEPLLASWF